MILRSKVYQLRKNNERGKLMEMWFSRSCAANCLFCRYFSVQTNILHERIWLSRGSWNTPLLLFSLATKMCMKGFFILIECESPTLSWKTKAVKPLKHAKHLKPQTLFICSFTLISGASRVPSTHLFIVKTFVDFNHKRQHTRGLHGEKKEFNSLVDFQNWRILSYKLCIFRGVSDSRIAPMNFEGSWHMAHFFRNKPSKKLCAAARQKLNFYTKKKPEKIAKGTELYFCVEVHTTCVWTCQYVSLSQCVFRSGFAMCKWALNPMPCTL